MRIEANHIGNLWFCLLEALVHSGRPVSPRSLPCRELLGVNLYLDDARNNVFVHEQRRLAYKFMVAEWLWIWYGHDDVATIDQYNPNIGQFSDDGTRFFGAYGPRIKEQWSWLLENLRKPDTRQAVIEIWRPTPPASRDVPCTLSWQLLLRDGKLNGIVTMRSSDAFLGVPYDVFSFTMLQNIAAAALNVTVGSYQLNVGSSHLYERDVNNAQIILETGEPRGLRSPQLLDEPPAGWLHDLLTHPENGGPHISTQVRADNPWPVYAQCLFAPTNLAALTWLGRLSELV